MSHEVPSKAEYNLRYIIEIPTVYITQGHGSNKSREFLPLATEVEKVVIADIIISEIIVEQKISKDIIVINVDLFVHHAVAV